MGSLTGDIRYADSRNQKQTHSLITLHVECAGRRRKYGILFMFSLVCECSNLESVHVRVPVIYRVEQAEYVIHLPVAASQEYVNMYSTRRLTTHPHTRYVDEQVRNDCFGAAVEIHTVESGARSNRAL